ncbi:hypothetical protein DVH24_003662 [Malus domestica]|uniref:Uncharacterized protein n=1 Tax=Malus domestica TaxID=3750 RepID=A0A498ILW9_MALDO|nr:hypothetical protein DVH24_003662 [Malus domestica]
MGLGRKSKGAASDHFPLSLPNNQFIIPFSRVMSLPNEENDKSSSSDAQGMDRSPKQQSLCNHLRENIVVILSSDSASMTASGPLPDPPNDYDTYYSMNQARSLRYYELGPDNQVLRLLWG